MLLYDGTCAFCRGWIARLRRWDRAGRLDYLSYQQRTAVAALPAISDEAVDRAMHLVMPDGQVRAGARAAPLILDYLPGGLVLKLLFWIPGASWAADRVYAWIAANRRCLGAAGDSCRLDLPAVPAGSRIERPRYIAGQVQRSHSP
jgi:predicted DCC family thiol-disulfide oxidoreductase YuxK